MSTNLLDGRFSGMLQASLAHFIFLSVSFVPFSRYASNADGQFPPKPRSLSVKKSRSECMLPHYSYWHLDSSYLIIVLVGGVR